MSYFNGVNGSAKGSSAMSWRVGLMNSEGRYLTAEAFGFKINASAQFLKKKQLWTLEHDTQKDNVVYLRSHLGRYLAGDKKGNVRCDSEDKGEDEQYTIEYEQGGYRWAIRNVKTGYYFGGTEDALRCYEKAPTQTEWWTLHLAVHPQVSMKNVNRKRYAHLNEAGDSIFCDELIPWGSDALITLVFKEGRYAVRAANNQYLHREGHLVGAVSNDTMFTLEIRSGQYSGLALKDCTGRFLTAIGKDGCLKGNKKSVSKDELFTLEDSHPQVFVTAHNGKKASIKQGIDVTANQDEVSDKEIFQVEFDKNSKKWRFQTCENKYWSLEQAQGIQATGNDSSGTGLFDIEWMEDGYCALQATNGKYVQARKNGSLYAVSDSISERERFLITIVNRPILVLRCEFGFVGFKTATSTKVECNKANYDPIYVEHSNGQNPGYFLKAYGHNGKYWAIAVDGTLNADSGEPHPFRFELRGQSKFHVKAPNGMYLRGENNGTMVANSDIGRSTQWEY